MMFARLGWHVHDTVLVGLGGGADALSRDKPYVTGSISPAVPNPFVPHRDAGTETARLDIEELLKVFFSGKPQNPGSEFWYEIESG